MRLFTFIPYIPFSVSSRAGSCLLIAISRAQASLSAAALNDELYYATDGTHEHASASSGHVAAGHVASLS